MDFGHLYIKTSEAQPNFLHKKIESPLQSIHFSKDQINSDNFINYITTQKKSLAQNAKNELNDFIKSLHSFTPINITGVGSFAKENDVINFQSAAFNSSLAPSAKAERVIHEAAQHSMLVGDKETTITQMTEYFADTPSVKDKWWVWALVLSIIGIGTILFHYFVDNQN